MYIFFKVFSQEYDRWLKIYTSHLSRFRVYGWINFPEDDHSVSYKQKFLFFKFKVCSQNIEGWLKNCTSCLVYSHIWKKILENNRHFFGHLTIDERHFGYKQKFLIKESPLPRRHPSAETPKEGRKEERKEPGGQGGSRREAKQRIKHHVNTATANSIVLRSLSSPPPWQRTCGRWCHARSGAKFDWWVVACPVLSDLSHVYAPI